jgi:uncharacterized protein YjbI with pentapeptide repeats
MANPEHLAILREGVYGWNTWRGRDTATKPNLSGASLRKLDLRRANLWQTDLSEADLRRADLREADLREANLIGADLRHVDLSGADASKARFGAANLSDAVFTGTDFTAARIGWTTFGISDLGVAKALETVEHAGPSTIGIDTIYRSEGKIPEAFLRGAGIPENFVAFVASLITTQFYSCFISYSTRDQEFAERLHADLQHQGVRCWFAPEDVQGGKKLHEQIDRAIQIHDRLLLILSPNSMASQWVQSEIARARSREMQEGRRVLFPVRLVAFDEIQKWKCFDSDTGKDSAREIREYFIPDFSNWTDHNSYQKAFDRLLRDLKSAEKTDHAY